MNIVGSVNSIVTNGSVLIINAAAVGSYAAPMAITGSVVTSSYTGDGFGYSGATFTASGTATNVWTPGTGSAAQLKGFSASARQLSTFRILFSGGGVIGQWTIPASGTVAMNMYGMEPSGAANQPIALGLLTGGSVDISVFARGLKP
jgi:hypothetical protein